MPIRYFIDLNCIPRETLGPEDLLAMVTRWERAQSIRRQFQEKYQVEDEARMKFRERVVSLEAPAEVREVTVARVREESQPLQEMAACCAGCPAALAVSPYSCVQQISLPIRPAAEEWLVENLAPSGTRAVSLFLEACESRGYASHSEVLANWRKANFLEADEPIRGERDGREVNSDEILTEMFLVGDIMPPHALGLLLHLDALETSDGRRGDELLGLIESVSSQASAESAPAIEFSTHVSQDDDPSVREIKQFLYALYIAFSLQSPLAIRL